MESTYDLLDYGVYSYTFNRKGRILIEMTAVITSVFFYKLNNIYDYTILFKNLQS